MNFPKNNISPFQHDPFGRRILKISKPCSGGVPDSDQTTWTFTYYVNDASGNVMATYDYKRTISNYNISLDEQMIYGSSRLGMRSPSKLLSTYYISGSTLTHEEADSTRRWCGLKRYEYTNHLGNVLLVTTDRKMSQDPNTNGVTDYYHAVVDAYYDYGPFGNILDERTGGNGYRYGFNGTEGDEEMYNNKASHDFGARVYNSDLGRWFSTDNYSIHYPDLSPYNFVGNSPIIAYDPDGNVIKVVGTKRYRRNVRKAFQKLVKNSSTARGIIESLINSQNYFVISDVDPKGSYPTFFEIKDVGTYNNGSSKVYSFSIGAADDDPLEQTNEGINKSAIENNFEVYLIHELAHAFSDDITFGYPDSDEKKEIEKNNCGIETLCDENGIQIIRNGKSISTDEVYAVDIENQVRSEMGLKLRHYYGDIEVFNKDLQQVGKTSGYKLVDSKSPKDYSVYKDNNSVIEDFKNGCWYTGGELWFKAKSDRKVEDYNGSQRFGSSQFGGLIYTDPTEQRSDGQRPQTETYSRPSLDTKKK